MQARSISSRVLVAAIAWIAFGFGIAVAERTAVDVSGADRLKGTWVCDALEVEGERKPLGVEYRRIVFEGGRCRIEWKQLAEDGGRTDEGKSYSVAVNPAKSPAEMTIYGDDMLIQAIYEVDGDQFRLAFFGKSEVDRPSSFESRKKGEIGSPLVTWKFRRAAK